MKKLLFIFVLAMFWSISKNADAQDTLMQAHGQVYERTKLGIQNTRNSIKMEGPAYGRYPYGLRVKDMRAFRSSLNELFRRIFSRERANELADIRLVIYIITSTRTAQIAEIRIISNGETYPLTAEETYRLEKALVGFQLDMDVYPEDAPPYIDPSFLLVFNRLYQ